MIRAILAGTLTLLASIGLTATSAWLITRAWEMPPVLDLAVAVTAVRALGISKAVFRYIDRLVSHDIALKRAAQTRTQAYRSLAEAPSDYTVRLGRGALLTRLGADVDMLTDEVVRALVPAGVCGLTSLVAIIGIGILSPAAAAVLALGLVVSGVVAPWLSARATRRREDARALTVQEHVTAIDRVLADAVSLRIRGELDTALEEAEIASHRLAAAEEPDAPAHGLAALSTLWTVLGVLLVVFMTADGHSPQWVGALALVPLAAFEATTVMPAAAVAWERARGARRRISELGVETQQNQRSAASDSLTLSAHDLQLCRGTLGTINLEVPFGERLRITAPSGAGKTTLLLTLAGLLEPRSGEVSVAPESVTCISEDDHIFATTIRDNLALGAPDATDEQMWEVLEALGLASWARSLPDGLSTVLSDGAESISGGQRRRILLARALLTDSPILLLDEPDEHLDDVGAAQLEALFVAPELPGARAVRTVVVASHPRADAGGLPVLAFDHGNK